MNESELYEFLSGVTHTFFDVEAMEQEKERIDVDFMMRDGRTVRGSILLDEFDDLFDFILAHKELADGIKLGPMGLTNKDLK